MEKERSYYAKLVKTKHDYTVMLKNFLSAFLFGGIVSLIGQGIYDLYYHVCKQSEINAGIYMYMSIIFISGLLTGLGIYDNLGQIAKCGLAIPISGFANAAVCSAMEYHKEGIVLGIGSNTLKLAGSVIVLGTTSAIFVAVIRYLMEWF